MNIIAILTYFLLCLACHGERPAELHPFQLSELARQTDRHNEKVAQSGEGKLQRLSELKASTIPLNESIAQLTSLLDKRILVTLSNDQKTIKFYDLKSQSLSKKIEEEAATFTLMGKNSILLSYLPGSRTLISRNIKKLNTPARWQCPTGHQLIAIAITGKNGAEQVVALDDKSQLYWFSASTLKLTTGPCLITEIDVNLRADFIFRKKTLKPLPQLCVNAKAEVFISNWKISPVGKKHIKSQSLNFRVTDSHIWNHHRLFTPYGLFDIKGKPLLPPYLKMKSIPCSKDTGFLIQPNSPPQLHVFNFKTNSVALSLRGLESTTNPRSTVTNPNPPNPLPPSQRIIYCPTQKKLILLNTPSNTIYLYDLDIEAAMKMAPKQTSPILTHKSGPYRFSFDNPTLIQSITPKTISTPYFINEKFDSLNPTFKWNPPTNKQIKPLMIAIITMKDGNQATAIVQLSSE